jgi:hypothetical protein
MGIKQRRKQMLNIDPRFLIADVYKQLRKHPEELAEFEKKLNNEVGSPEEAVRLCLEYASVGSND